VCAACFTVYRREHYRLNRAAYIERNNEVLQRRRHRWRQRLLAHLERHPCVDCGEQDPTVLEFDHLEPSLKRAEVTTLATRGYPWEEVATELSKCETRCANCHRRRTAAQFDWPKLAFCRREAQNVTLGGPDETRTREPLGCEPSALPPE